jgi:hypothetical protein
MPDAVRGGALAAGPRVGSDARYGPPPAGMAQGGAYSLEAVTSGFLEARGLPTPRRRARRRGARLANSAASRVRSVGEGGGGARRGLRSGIACSEVWERRLGLAASRG